MKRHHTTMAAGICTGTERRALEGVAKQIRPAAVENTTEQHIKLAPGAAGPSAPPQEKATPSATHTLVLSGRLDLASTHTLEAEIERLCQAKVRMLVVDLSGLWGIDRAGVAVIAFRSRWCAKRGCQLVLVQGPPAIREAFESAGVIDDLVLKEADGAAYSARRS
jgi:anti-anti-sigma factor